MIRKGDARYGSGTTVALAAVAVGIAGGVCFAQPEPESVRPAEPRLVNGDLVYPDQAPIPRYLTPVERAYLARHPLTTEGLLRGPGGPTPPDGPVWCAPEYAPMEGLCLSWEGGASLTSIVTQIALRITAVGGRAYIGCDPGTVTSATNSLTNAGVTMSLVTFVPRTMDSIWIRDYGPRYITEGPCRAIVDHVYNRPRPNDNTFPISFGLAKKHAVYALPLIHGGGNYHLNGLGEGHATRLINNENPGLTEQQIHDLWLDFQNCDTIFHTPFPTSIDATQHIDMWVQIIGETSVIVSDWPNNPGSVQDTICDQAAAAFTAAGWTVHRPPARSVNGTHYTYTNVVMFNDIVLLPSYTNGTVAPHNAAALAIWQAACPDKTIYQINCQSIVTLAGVMHCIVMHVPVAPGGAIPTAYLKTLRGGESVLPGAVQPIKWLADDNVGVTGVDLLLSMDAGATFPTVLATNVPHTGSYNWTVPDTYTRNARIKIVAHDVDANTGFDASASSFTIEGTCPADFNHDGVVGSSDITAYLTAWFADLANGTTLSNFDAVPEIGSSDITAFLTAWFEALATGC
ncbi:MAG: agmatine deiminase family protein [Phycisphaerales bacterium]|nr:agmatine deiminase family protein [Phycisphaerales bacterium]